MKIFPISSRDFPTKMCKHLTRHRYNAWWKKYRKSL